jgi:hypothetical protein
MVKDKLLRGYDPPGWDLSWCEFKCDNAWAWLYMFLEDMTDKKVE